eukprot:scaffold36158_cov45-Phaeocystis_antarctica.AAC.1
MCVEGTGCVGVAGTVPADCCEHWNSHPGGKIRLGLIVAHRNVLIVAHRSGQEVEAGAAAGGATLQGASAQQTRARLREWANPNLNSTRVYRVLSRVALQVVLTLLPYFRTCPASCRYPQHRKLNGSSFGRPDMDLMFAKWAFNKNVPHMAHCRRVAHLPMHMHNHGGGGLTRNTGGSRTLKWGTLGSN